MSGKPRIPAWQQATNDNSSTPPSNDEIESKAEPIEQAVPAPTPTEEDVSTVEGELAQESEDSTLLDQASRFLEDPTIRDASRERKVAFLEGKGVKTEDIERLLGETAVEKQETDLGENAERAWSTAPRSTQPPPKQAPREIPPIVTYPEFLANTEKPPPLITTQRLATTAYVASGLMATLYGFSKYIIAPMAHNLAESRHDFASHTQEQLEDLNSRLLKSCSVDPAIKTKTISEAADDISEADSDPTELFHRDYGTQTTPNLSRRPSTSTDAEPMVTAHESRLKIIKSHLEELESNRSASASSRDTLRTKVSDLSSYLSEMSYQNQYYSNMSGLYGSGSTFGMGGGGKDKNDAIEVLKQDIRAVKGVFLSARNFPTGGGAGASGGRTSPMPTGR